MTTFNLTENQLNTLIVNITQAVLTTLNDTTSPNIKTKDRDNIWSSATTTRVSQITLEQYDWKPLRKYCLDNDIEIEKELVGTLPLNSYPAEAWFAIYGIELGKFNV